MNYRHRFHAGNFADVMKHALLVRLARALQKKEKGFLYLDTHAGSGAYDLASAATGDSLARKPEWPDGIGRIAAAETAGETGHALPATLTDYLEVVRNFDALERGQAAKAGAPSDGSAGAGVRDAAGEQGAGAGENAAAPLRFYPGSPWIARALMRPQDRMALCERHPLECGALRDHFGGLAGVSVHEMDGYGAVRAMLPPPERRALVLIDPPFEAQDEFAQIAQALAEGLRRFPSGVFAVWYPLTERARVNEFFDALRDLRPPPTLAIELMIAGDQSPLKMKGCGLVVINPPWQFDTEAGPLVDYLAEKLAQAPGARSYLEWLVREAP